MSNTEKLRKLEEIAAVAARSLTTSNSGRKFKRSKATILAALREAAEGMKRRCADECDKLGDQHSRAAGDASADGRRDKYFEHAGQSLGALVCAERIRVLEVE